MEGGEKMEGYELYRLSDEEIQHVGVKGMKWGKRKSRSAYMTAVDKHEAKTKANRQKVADHKAREKEQGKAVAKAVGKKYMGAVAKHEAKSKANNEKLAAHKAREKEAGKKAFKKGKEKAISALNNPKVNKTLNKAVNAHEKKGQDISNAKAKEKSDKRAINAQNRKTKVKLSKDEKDAIAEEKFWAKDAKDKARVERNKARMAKVMGQKAVDVLTAPENRVKIAAVTSILAAYEGTQMRSAKNARLMREFNSHNYKI